MINKIIKILKTKQDSKRDAYLEVVTNTPRAKHIKECFNTLRTRKENNEAE